MVAFPFCKINLGLHIIRKRDDGYHDIATVFYPVPWTDVLEVIPAAAFAYSSSGLVVDAPVESNLCVKAYRLVARDYDLPPVRIHLHKVVPMGAGLGGGSSDAAHMLRLLDDVFSLNMPHETMSAYAAALGSDCAFFLAQAPMLGTGRGEVLTPARVTLKDKFLVVVKPDVHVSTAAAYAGIQPQVPETDLLRVIEQYPPHEWKNWLKNDFEPGVIARHTVIGDVRRALYDAGAVFAAMSGSGSAVFGIFNQPVDLKGLFPATAYWSGMLSR